MKTVFQRLSWSAVLVLLMFGGGLAPYASAALPNIPPAVLAQLQNLSPEEQAELARQYGFELPGQLGANTGEDSALGAPGIPLELDERAAALLQEQEIQELLGEQGLKAPDDDVVELSRFGLDLFDREFSTFAPVDDMPAPDKYRVGPGDSINVYMYGNEEADLVLTVNRDGQLVLPRLGPMSVVGLTFEEVKEMINAKVASQLVGTKAVISLGKLRSIGVFLAGDVVVPGSYSVSGLSTVLQVLYMAGGISEIGSLRNIQVKRAGKVVGTFDAYDVLLRGDTSGDIRLASGDTVFVPTADRLVTLDGEVKRPAIHEVLETDTLGDLIQMSGGLSSAGYAKSASIERRVPGQSSMTRVQVDLTNEEDLETALEDGDRLVVASIKSEVTNEVLLRGAVARPGGYAWSEGQRVSDLIGSVDDDLLAETDLSSALLVRRTGVGLQIEALALDLGEAVKFPGSEADLELQPLDEVFVFGLPYLDSSYQALIDSATETDEVEEAEGAIEVEPVPEKKFEERLDLIEEVVFRLEAQAETPSETPVVKISGDVRLPGKYPLLADRSLDALIAMAGGFENSAFLNSVEITRLSFSKTGDARVSAFKIPLEDGVQGRESFQLEPLDQVRVARIPNWSYGDTVGLTGAVLFPGDYPITPGENLSSVLLRAGGMAENAFPEAAVLIKVEAQKREREQLERLIASIQRNSLAQAQTREQETAKSGSSAPDDLDFLQDVLENGATGRVVIDLPAILAGDPDADIQLEAGDSLFIPEFNDTITVIGEVRQPGTFQYDGSRNLSDYIDQAAGATVRADEDETYVVRANGSVERVRVKVSLLSFTPVGASGLQPGDTIIVPVNEEYQPVLARYKEISTVVFQSIASLYPLFRL